MEKVPGLTQKILYPVTLLAELGLGGLHPFLAEMISASTAPMVLPAFSWFYQEEEIVRDIGWKYEKWDSHSAQRIKELLSLTE